MRFTKYSLSLAIVAALSAFGVSAIPHVARAQTEASSPEKIHEARETFARNFATMVLAIIQDPKKSMGDRKDILRQSFSKSVDIDWIAKFILGKAWNNASAEEKERYTTLYRKYLTESYVTNFAENPDKRIRDIKIFGVNDSDATPDKFVVRTQMQLADQEDVNVNYLVREENGHYKVLDIIIENVSLITTHRAQFGGMAASKGVNTVIAKLQELMSKPITVSLN